MTNIRGFDDPADVLTGGSEDQTLPFGYQKDEKGC